MFNEANKEHWNDFVEIGTNIHLMRGQYRILEAMRALEIAKRLVENEFIVNLPIKDKQLYKTLLPKIAEYLDRNEAIQEAVKDHFLVQHGKSGLNELLFHISFSPKWSGIHIGLVCDVYNGGQSVRYYVKTHQNGLTEDNVKSVKPPDAKELFVYRLLELIGMGPEAHFIIPFRGAKKTVYIGTRDCHLVPLSELTKDTAKNEKLCFKWI